MSYSPPALKLFEERGIDPAVAEKYGVTEDAGALHFPDGRARSLDGGQKHQQPSGVQLAPWCPQGNPEPGDVVLVCEGETDTLAALSALEVAPDSPLDHPKLVGLPGASFPPERLGEGLAACELVYLAFDGDEAGRKAEAKAARALTVPAHRLGIAEGSDLAATLAASSDPGSTIIGLLADSEEIERFQNEPETATLDSAGQAQSYVVNGAAFVFGEEDDYEVVWGRDHEILWAAGEPLLICGGDGTGKTTIAQQLTLGRLRGEDTLGYPVTREAGRVLYVAADRPRQAKRSIRRMVDEEDAKLLSERLIVMRRNDFKLSRLNEIAAEHGAGTVFLDTLGAVAGGDVGKNEIGMEIYDALERACAAGIEVCVLHHNRKEGSEYRGIEDVYGSRWITAGCGSVLLLRGKPGSSEIWLRHVKQPDEPVGPAKVHHDSRVGRSYLD